MLGEGGFATVYRTRHQFLHSTHAIKVLLPHLASDPEMRNRFLSEGRIQAGLRHPNIIAVTDIVTDPSPGLVMEHIEGPTLTELLSERGAALQPREIAAVMLAMLDAVGAAHAAGIVHRDLKPDNVLVTRRGAELWPMVGDFGIAKILEASTLDAAKQKTRTGMRMGTLHYMSPEQIRGASTVDARTDIFALGAILYECATGRSAFAGDSEFDTMRNIVDGRFDPPERVAAGVSPALAECIRRALAPAADARFQDCGAFGAALREALTSLPLAAPGAGRPVAAPEAKPAVGTNAPEARFAFAPGHAHPDLVETPGRVPENADGWSMSMCWFCGGRPADDSPPYVVLLHRGAEGRREAAEVSIPYCGVCRRGHRYASLVNPMGAVGAIGVALAFLGSDDPSPAFCGFLALAVAYGGAKLATGNPKPLSHYQEYPLLRRRLAAGWTQGTLPKGAGG